MERKSPLVYSEKRNILRSFEPARRTGRGECQEIRGECRKRRKEGKTSGAGRGAPGRRTARSKPQTAGIKGNEAGGDWRPLEGGSALLIVGFGLLGCGDNCRTNHHNNERQTDHEIEHGEKLLAELPLWVIPTTMRNHIPVIRFALTL